MELRACRQQAITWTNVDLTSGRSLGIHLRALSLDNVKIPVNKTRSKIAVLKWLLSLPGANGLMQNNPVVMVVILILNKKLNAQHVGITIEWQWNSTVYSTE